MNPTPETKSDVTIERRNPTLAVVAVVAVVIPAMVAFSKARGDLPYALGAATGQLFIIGLIVGLFSIFKRFRIRQTFPKVVIGVALFVLLVSLAMPPV